MKAGIILRVRTTCIRIYRGRQSCSRAARRPYQPRYATIPVKAAAEPVDRATKRMLLPAGCSAARAGRATTEENTSAKHVMVNQLRVFPACRERRAPKAIDSSGVSMLLANAASMLTISPRARVSRAEVEGLRASLSSSRMEDALSRKVWLEKEENLLLIPSMKLHSYLSSLSRRSPSARTAPTPMKPDTI